MLNSRRSNPTLAAARCAALVFPTVARAGERAAGEGSTRGNAAEPANPFLAAGAPDHGWPFLRGPNYDGRSPETNLADAWPAAGPPVLWTRELGQGYSGFVAWNGRVATQCQTLAGQYVVCLEADSGRVLWQYRYDWPYEAAGLLLKS